MMMMMIGDCEAFGWEGWLERSFYIIIFTPKIYNMVFEELILSSKDFELHFFFLFIIGICRVVSNSMLSL